MKTLPVIAGLICSGAALLNCKGEADFLTANQKAADQAEAANFIYLDGSEDAEAEEAIGKSPVVQELRTVKKSLRQTLMTKVLDCAGLDKTPFENLREKKQELKDSNTDREEAKRQLAPLRESVKSIVMDNKDKLAECKLQIKAESPADFLALQHIRENCGHRGHVKHDSKKHKRARNAKGGKKIDFEKLGGKMFGAKKRKHKGKHHFNSKKFLEKLNSQECKDAVAAAKALS